MRTTCEDFSFVARREVAAGDERDAHRLDVILRDDAEMHVGQFTLGHRAAFDLKRGSNDVVTQGQRKDGAGSLDSGQSTESSEQIAKKRDGLLGFAVARVGKVEVEREDVVGIEARRLPCEVNHALDEKAGADEKDHGEGNLSDDEQIAGA